MQWSTSRAFTFILWLHLISIHFHALFIGWTWKCVQSLIEILNFSWLHTGSNAKAINPSSRRDVVFFIAMHIFTSVIQSYSLFFTLLFHNIKSRSEESITSSKMFMPRNHAEKIFHLNAVQFGLGQVSTLNVANKKWLIVDCFSYSMYRMKYGKTAEVMSKVYVWRQVNVDYSITAWIV